MQDGNNLLLLQVVDRVTEARQFQGGRQCLCLKLTLPLGNVNKLVSQEGLVSNQVEELLPAVHHHK